MKFPYLICSKHSGAGKTTHAQMIAKRFANVTVLCPESTAHEWNNVANARVLTDANELTNLSHTCLVVDEWPFDKAWTAQFNKWRHAGVSVVVVAKWHYVPASVWNQMGTIKCCG